jgi:hypothetical protein
LLLLPGRSLLLARATTPCVHRCWLVLLLLLLLLVVLGLQAGTCGVNGRRGPTETHCIALVVVWSRGWLRGVALLC